MCVKIYQRFNDKATFFCIAGAIVIAFMICLSIYAIEYNQVSVFWAASTPCVVNQDFQCLLDVRNNQAIHKEFLLTIMGLNLSIIGVFFGFLMVFLFKKIEWINKKKDTDGTSN